MKKSTRTLLILSVFALLMVSVESSAQMGPGMMGPRGGYGPGPGWQQDYDDWYCPYCGRPYGGRGMGPGMMGRGMGPGMMGPRGGYGMGPGMMGPGYGWGPQYQQPPRPLDKEEVRSMLDYYLKSSRNPNLKLGKIEDKGAYFEAEVLTRNDALVDKVLVDKNTGWMRSLY